MLLVLQLLFVHGVCEILTVQHLHFHYVATGMTSCRILQDHHHQSTFVAACSVWFHCYVWLR